MFEPLNPLERGLYAKTFFQTKTVYHKQFYQYNQQKRLNLKLNLFVMHYFSLKELLCVKSPFQGDLGIQTRVFFKIKI